MAFLFDVSSRSDGVVNPVIAAMVTRETAAGQTPAVEPLERNGHPPQGNGCLVANDSRTQRRSPQRCPESRAREREAADDHESRRRRHDRGDVTVIVPSASPT